MERSVLLLGPVRAVPQVSDFCVMGDLTQEDPPDQSLLGSGVAVVHLLGLNFCFSAGRTLVDASKLINHCRALALVQVT